MSDKASRFRRRLQERKLQQEIEARRLEQLPLRHPLGDPRVGNDRRQQERRVRSMSPEEVAQWLKDNHISGGDRRKGNRRQGDRRR